MANQNPVVTSVEIVPAQPDPADRKVLAFQRASNNRPLEDIAYVVKLFLAEALPPTGAGFALFLDETRIPRYSGFDGGIYFTVHDPQFLANHAGTAIQFKHDAGQMIKTQTLLPGLPAPEAATYGLLAARTAAQLPLPTKAEALSLRMTSSSGLHGVESARPPSNDQRRTPVTLEDQFAELLKNEEVPTAALATYLRRVTPTEDDLSSALEEAIPEARGATTVTNLLGKKFGKKDGDAVSALLKSGGPEMLSSALEGTGRFGGLAWRLYKKLHKVKWEKRGKFVGDPAVIARGGRDYTYKPNPANPFKFIRSTDEEITPSAMITDGGSIPRVAWVIPGLDPWTYMPAYLIHDWDFIVHHCDPDKSRDFDEVNLTLAEAVYTLMMDNPNIVTPDWRKVEIIYQGVSSFVGKGVWNRAWTQGQCQTTLNPN